MRSILGPNPVMKKAYNTSGARELPNNAFSLQFRETALYEPARLIAIELVNWRLWFKVLSIKIAVS